MRTLLFLLQKEFLQIFRNKTMLPMIFVMPIIQLVILVNAATFDMKNINFAVVDNDLSQTSRQMIGKFQASPFFKYQGISASLKESLKLMYEGKVDLIINVSEKFDHSIVRENKGNVQLIINAINGSSAGLISSYSQAIIAGYNQEVITEWYGVVQGDQMPKRININPSFWYNPMMNYVTYMLPGLLVVLITVIGMFLSSMNLVREKEIGTIEQLNVSPITRYQFLLSKLIPFYFIALFELGFGLLIGKLLYHIPIVGSLALVFLMGATYLLAVLGMGLFVSTMVDTQQQAMFIAWFFMLVFILMSGLFTSTASMPDWAQTLNYINPITYFIRMIRMVLLKGSRLSDVLQDLLSLLAIGMTMLTLASLRYRKVAS